MQSEFSLLKEVINRKVLRFALLSIAGMIIIIFAVMYFFKEPPPEPELYTITKQDLEITFIESGKIQPVRSKEIAVQSLTSGLIILSREETQIVYLIPEGTFAQPGDTLVKLDVSNLLTQRETLVEELNTEVQSYEDLLENQKLEERKDERKLDNINYELESKRLEVQLAEYSSDNTQKQKQLQLEIALLDSIDKVTEIAGQRVERKLKLYQAELRVTNAEKKLSALDDQIASFTIIAENPALVVYAQNYDTGQKYEVGDKLDYLFYPLLQLPDLSSIYAILHVNDIDRSKAWIGQEGRLRLEAYPDTVFTGKVNDLTISSSSTPDIFMPVSQNTNVKTFTVRFLLDGTDKRMRPGMKASVELIVERLEDVLAVPLTSVFEYGAKPCVYVADGDELRLREVELGKRNSVMVVIENGLEEGDKILKQPLNYAGAKLGEYEELRRREEGIAILDEHFKAIEELGIQYDYDKFREEEEKKAKQAASPDTTKKLRIIKY
ncbi:hypothetical protein AMJ80_06370 [bacterium SM23_31]|nr:MAG: hypothetical protein AMJ80_06370 [bacterium SM23_31]